MDKIILNLIIYSFFSTITLGNLTAYTQEIIDENMMTTQEVINGKKLDLSWPALHKSLLKKDFSKVHVILDIYPEEAQMTVQLNYPDQDFYIDIKGYNSTTTYYRHSILGMTSLELAILCDAPLEIIEKLILFGANVNNHRIKKGSSNCKEDSYLMIPENFREHSFNCHYYEVRTPLLAAVIKRNNGGIQLLLDYGANPEQVVFEEEIVEIVIGWDPESGAYKNLWEKSNWIHLSDLLSRES